MQAVGEEMGTPSVTGVCHVLSVFRSPSWTSEVSAVRMHTCVVERPISSPSLSKPSISMYLSLLPPSSVLPRAGPPASG